MLKKTVLRGKKDFAGLYKKGKSNASKYIVVFFRKNNLEYNRVAFLASKKVGKSVVRNKAKRHMKEVYRYCRNNMATGYDIIFIGRNSMNDVDYFELKKTTIKLLQRLKLLKGDISWNLYSYFW